jgi:hypothetical protein
MRGVKLDRLPCNGWKVFKDTCQPVDCRYHNTNPPFAIGWGDGLRYVTAIQHLMRAHSMLIEQLAANARLKKAFFVRRFGDAPGWCYLEKANEHDARLGERRWASSLLWS